MVFLQSKIRMKISTTVSAPWQPDFPAFVFLFLAPLCISLLLHPPAITFISHTHLLPQILWFPNLAVLVTDLTTCALTPLGPLLTDFWLASSPPWPCTLPYPRTMSWQSEHELLVTTLWIRC